MKDVNKARVVIFILGLFLIISVFFLTLIPLNTHENLRTKVEVTLPEGVSIPININTADKETLCLLDGIGETLAEYIIAYREENGDFKTTEDIINVKRIGENTYEQIKNYICVTG